MDICFGGHCKNDNVTCYINDKTKTQLHLTIKLCTIIMLFFYIIVWNSHNSIFNISKSDFYYRNYEILMINLILKIQT